MKVVTKENKYTFNENDGWYGIDLDGTLAYLDTKKFPEIGKPVPLIYEKLKKLLEVGVRVKIFTARASEEIEIERIRKWLKENDLPENLEITNVKDYNCIEIWDDRVRRVLFNTGYFSDVDMEDENFEEYLTLIKEEKQNGNQDN